MKRTLVGLVSALLMLSTLMVAQAAKQTGGVEQALIDMEKKWTAALLKGDIDSVGALLSEKWMGTNTEGKFQAKAQVLDGMKKAKLTRSEVSDMKVRMLGKDVAVVTGAWSGAGTDPKGQKFDSVERFTDVFMNEGGKWLCVASQNTTVKK